MSSIGTSVDTPASLAYASINIIWVHAGLAKFSGDLEFVFANPDAGTPVYRAEEILRLSMPRKVSPISGYTICIARSALVNRWWRRRGEDQRVDGTRLDCDRE